MTVIEGTEIERACAQLLGADFCARPGWRRSLDPHLLKRAFRERVFAVHPDRACSLGIPASILQERFVRLQRCYDQLLQFLSRPAAVGKGSSPNRTAPTHSPRTTSPKPPAVSTFYLGQRPSRCLKLGEFLCYDGHITQQDLFSAIRWQSRQRPRVGEIAVSFGYLDAAGINHLLELRQEARKLHEPLAEFARNQGYLSHFQWLAVLGRQRRLQKPIGDYWIERKHFTARQLAELVRDQRQHNWYYAEK